jgi:isoleucyl-tRNA synthetase
MGSMFSFSSLINIKIIENKKKDIVNRMGRWIDFRHDYKTMYPWFMESVWFVFKQLYEKGFVYRGFKV